MKQLLHIPTGNIISFSYENVLVPFETYCNFTHKSFDEIMEHIICNYFLYTFYKRNNIPDNAIKEEFEVVEI